MAIAKLDESGNLPVGPLVGPNGRVDGLLPCTLAEIHEQFVAGVRDSKTRDEIWGGWMRHRTDFERVGVPYATMVDGSFTTVKRDPSDIDLCILVDAPTLDALTATEYREFERLTETSLTKPEYRCDVYHVAQYPVTDPRFYKTAVGVSYWTRVFGHDKRTKRPKAILLVTEGGVL